jgi:predicted O-linked N-acetylglucosamine transferase (SPINDLY family)
MTQTASDLKFQRAILAHKAGRLSEAERLYRDVLSQHPQHADANHNLGVIAVTAGQAELSLPLFKAALQANPTQSQYWVSYVDALLRSRRVDEAAAVLAQGRRHGLKGPAVDELEARVAARGDQSPVAADGAGLPPSASIDALLSALRDGRYAEAEQMAADLSSRFPRHPLAWTVTGRIRQRQGRLGEALLAMRTACELASTYAAAHLHVAEVLAQMGRLEEAEVACRQAIALDAQHAAAHSQLGEVLLGLGRLEEAEASCRHAILLQPELLDAHGNLGIVLRGQGRLDEAEACCRHAVSLRPDHPGGHANLGAVLVDRGRMVEAEASCRQAIALMPTNVEAHVNLGVALMGQGRFDNAIDSFRQALALDPDGVDAHSNLLFCMNYMAEVRPEQALAEAKAYGERLRSKVTQPFRQWRCEAKPTRLRVGFVSGDFRSHPVAYFLLGLLSGLGGARLELLAYPTNGMEDDMTARLKPHFAAWRPIWRLDDADAARRIHDDGVHVLIDLAGHTAHNRLPVFVHKPAPVQAAWLGYFATTGLVEMDHVLGDPHVTPLGEEPHFIEHVWRLPETYFCFSPPDMNVAVSPLPARESGVITFGCFNNLSKVNDATLALWGRVLAQLPDSRLFLKAGQLDDLAVRNAMGQRLAKVGVSADRVVLEGASSRRGYFEAFGRVDVALDPFPFPGGTTSVEGLWMGVPVLTRRGDRFIGHNGETIARNAGLSEWVAQDADDYVGKACRLTSDLDQLSELRASLRPRLLASPLFDSTRFALHFESALWGMWEEFAGKAMAGA